MIKQIASFLLVVLCVSCQTRMISVNFVDLNKSAIEAIHKYYPEYKENDLMLSSISYSSHISLLSKEPLPQTVDQFSDRANEGIYVGYIIKSTISDHSTNNHKIIKSKTVYISLNSDGTPIAGKGSISFTGTTQKMRK